MTDSGRSPTTLRDIASGFRGRTLKTMGLASRVGFRALKKQVRPSSPLRPTNGESVSAAEELFETLDGMKGLVMKFGQMASYLDTTLPPRAREALARLQSNSSAVAWDVVEKVLCDELGAQPAELFDHIAEAPFAAASIGQVHRARRGDRWLAVKIQYPGVEGAIRGDLKTLGRLTRLGSFVTAMDGKALAEELRDRVLEECDYHREAQHQGLFRQLFASDQRVVIPRVVTDRSARRVLTTELAPGERFEAFSKSAPQFALDNAGTIIFETVFRSLLGHCIFNADPHPGNYLFPGSGRVVFLDFGSVRTFEKDFIDRWKRLARTVLDGDRVGFKRLYVEAGFVPKPSRFDWDYQWEVMSYVNEPFLTPDFRFTAEYVQRSYDMLIWKNPNRRRTAMPREWLLLNRLQWGLYSVLALLNARGPWQELWRRAIESPTVPVAVGSST